MAEGYKSYRIRTKVGQDAPNVVNVHLDQTYDEFQILSLKIDQQNSYNLYQSDKGIIVGRVLANGGVGVSNAKISIFVETDDTMGLDKHILYPYSSVNDINNDRVRYNLLPDYVDEDCHQNVGTFPNKRFVLDNDDVIEVFDRFWKYTTVTNTAGDYMLYGIPAGNQTLHMDVDLSDIGLLSQRPRDMIYKGYNINQFESPNKFKEDTNLNSLAQIKSQDVGVFVYPFWGDSTDNPDNIAVTRCDIQVDYKFEPTCIFIGSIITDTGSNAIGKNCAGTDNVGKMSDLVAGEGSIEMIRKTIDNKVEEFQIKGNRVIDGDGVWCYQIPMNLDYVMTDEFGNLVPTDNPDKGIPTRTRVRFRISLDDAPSDNTARKRCKYLVPNNPRIDSERFPVFTADEAHEPDYEFGTNTREESYCDLFWNKVYTVKNYIPRIQKNTKITNRKHTGIKLINHYGDNNPMPYNNLSIKLSFTYRFICVLTKIFIKLVGFLNNIITLLGMIPCQLAEFFRSIAGFFNFKVLGWRPLRPVAKLFEKIAAIFDLMTPSCIAISSEFCSGDVTHAYTFYPGCGMFLGLTFGLLKCVWNKTKENHNKHMINGEVNEEDRTTAINKSVELYNCVESQLAEDNDATSFNFQNDWINGTLYSPLWFRKITPKRSFLFGLFKRRAKDEWCSADHVYNGLVRIFHPCAVKRTQVSNDRYTNYDGENITPIYMQNGDCTNKCHERKTIVGLNTGLIRTRQTMLGQTVYYYKPIEYDSSLKEIKLLFASDIVLLGSLNDCDLNGVPQFFKSLESTTYKLPPNMLFTDNVIEQHINEDGTLSNDFDQISTSEMTGNDWGNSNDDMCGKPDGGLFYSIGCSTIEMQQKSCINLSRICEFGVALDETKQIPNYTALKSSDNAYDTLVPDGFISRDELYNDDERSMFATMNGNELRTKLNTENGLKEYDFRHIYVNNFDNSLKELMTNRQKRCGGYTYSGNYNLEEFSKGYYDFRMGRNPYFYDSGDNTLPRYENSFYFYFGLKVGKTAIDKFNSQFFAECYNPEDAISPIGIQSKGNSWCSNNCTNNGDGYVAFDLSNISLSCDILLQNNNETNIEYNFKDISDEKFYVGSNVSSDIKTKLEDDGYVLKTSDEGDTWILNGSYTITITDNDGEIITGDLNLNPSYLKYNVDYANFKTADNILTQTKTREQIGADTTGLTDDSRTIGGTILVSNIKDGQTYNDIDDFILSITSTSSEGVKYGLFIKKDGTDITDYTIYTVGIKLLKRNSGSYLFGVPKADETYTITVREVCSGGCETDNVFTQKVKIKDATPYKLYINDDIDYDVISDWGSGWKLNSETAALNNGTFSDNWLNMSDKSKYKWENLIVYKKEIDKINLALKQSNLSALPSGQTAYKQQDGTKSPLYVIIENYTENTNIDEDLRDIIKNSLNTINEIEDNFISAMKEAFQLNCPNESKTITFRATTDDMPVMFKIAYRSEIAVQDEDRNTLEKNSMSFTKDSDRVEDIRIPTISSVNSERFGNSGNKLPGHNDLCYASDNLYNGSNKIKEPYFVSVINSHEVNGSGEPNGETIPVKVTNSPVYKEFFGFHIIDKILNINYIAWATMIGIPYYKPASSKNGKTVTMNGLFASKILNGNAQRNGDISLFETAKIGMFDMLIATKDGEDDIPTDRCVVGATYNDTLINTLPVLKDYLSFQNYSVNKLFNNDYTDTDGKVSQYVPLLPATVNMELTDYNNCSLTDEIYGGMVIKLSSDSVNNCRDRKNSIFNVEVENGPGDSVTFFAFDFNTTNDYPLNYVDDNKLDYAKDDSVTFNTGAKYIFGYLTTRSMFESKKTSKLTSSSIDDYGNETTGLVGYGTTGVFDLTTAAEQEYYIVAVTENNCRVISPVYDYVDVYGGLLVGIVKTKTEDSSSGGDESNDTEEEGDDKGGDTPTPTVTYKDIEEYAVGFYVSNAKDVYYLNNFSYTLNGLCQIDDLHKVEYEGDVYAQSDSDNVIALYTGITETMYELIKGYMNNPLSKGILTRATTITVTDKSGLKHICCINTGDISMDEWYAVVYRPDGGYWPASSDTSTTPKQYDTSDKTIYLSRNDVSSYDICDNFGEPEPTDEMAEEGYTFLGWYDATDESKTTIPCGTIITNNESKIFIAKWLTLTTIIWLADEDNQGHFSDGTTSYTQDLTDTEIGVAQSCPMGEPTNDQSWIFDGWECVSNCDDVTIEDNKVTTEHTTTVRAKWKKAWVVRWIDDGDESESETVNVTFKVSTNNGKWSDNTTSDYVMEVEKNSSVTCDKIAISQRPLLYGFVGWNTDSTASTGDKTISVGTSDITVYAIYKTKDCQISIEDVSTGSDNITLNIESESQAGGTHWEWISFTGTCTQNMTSGTGTLECNGITSSSILKLYVADSIFYQLNGNSYYAEVFKNNAWHIEEINAMLQDYNICYTDSSSEDDVYVLESQNSSNSLVIPVDAGTTSLSAYISTKNGEYYDDLTFDSSVTWIQPSGIVTNPSGNIAIIGATIEALSDDDVKDNKSRSTTITVKQNGGKTADLEIIQRLSTNKIKIKIILKNDDTVQVNFSTLGIKMSNGRSFDFSCPYSVAAGSQTDAFEIEISDYFSGKAISDTLPIYGEVNSGVLSPYYASTPVSIIAAGSTYTITYKRT